MTNFNKQASMPCWIQDRFTVLQNESDLRQAKQNKFEEGSLKRPAVMAVRLLKMAYSYIEGHLH